MEKAYGRLEWDFILKCFQQLGFYPTWLMTTQMDLFSQQEELDRRTYCPNIYSYYAW